MNKLKAPNSILFAASAKSPFIISDVIRVCEQSRADFASMKQKSSVDLNRVRELFWKTKANAYLGVDLHTLGKNVWIVTSGGLKDAY